MTSSEDGDPIASAAKGATKGILEFGTDKIRDLVTLFKKKEILGFIPDQEIIKEAKQTRATAEYDLIKSYTRKEEDKDIRILFQLGLTLRRYEKELSKSDTLRNTIYNKYGVEGLHFAKIVQNRIFSKYFSIIIDSGAVRSRVRSEIRYLFENIEKVAFFVKKSETVEKAIDQIYTKICANSPHIFIISSAMDDAVSMSEEIVKAVLQRTSGYKKESYHHEEKGIHFLIKDAQEI